MSNTYSWVISELESYPTQDGFTDVVFNIHWRRQATDGLGHNADIYGTQTVVLTPDEPFTPYNALTETQVVSWLELALGPEKLASQVASLDKQIEDQVNPPVISPALPWA